MELQTAINQRRSVRNFTDQKVDRFLIEKIITAGALAPSACDLQGWKFIVVDNDVLKNKLVENGGSVIIKNAPVGILVVYDHRTLGKNYQDHVQSAAAAIENMFLTTTELGLGCCWVCHLPPAQKIRRIFNIPDSFSPIAYLLLGYPSSVAKEIPRKYTLSEIMAFNHFDQKWPAAKVNSGLLIIKKILAKIYYFSPLFLKKLFLNKLLDKKFVKKFEN